MKHDRDISAQYAGMRRQWLEAFPKPADLKYTRAIMRQYNDQQVDNVAYMAGKLHPSKYTM